MYVIMNIYEEVENYEILAKKLGKAYEKYVEMTYADPGKYSRNEKYGRTEDGKYWYRIVVSKNFG